MRRILASCLLLLASAATAQERVPVRVGGEFQVNTVPTGPSASPDVAVAPDGSFVVVWGSFDDLSIQGQLYDPNGVKLGGGPFEVATVDPGPAPVPTVAMDSSGNFVVVWESVGSAEDSSGSGIRGRRFDDDGTPLGTEFQVNTLTSGSQASPDVAVAPDGSFVVVWQSDVSAGDDVFGPSIQGQRYDANGMPAASQFQVNNLVIMGSQERPSVAINAGFFVVVWDNSASTAEDGDPRSIQGRLYAAGGTAEDDEFQVNTTTTSDQYQPSVARSTGGVFVVVWESVGSSGSDASATSIQSQRYSADGTPLFGELQVNTYTPSEQSDPAVAVDATDAFVVWTSLGSSGSDNSGTSIQAEHFAFPGGPIIDGEIEVNTKTAGFQLKPSVAGNASGNFVIVWEGPGPGGFDVYGQRFTFNTPPVVSVTSPTEGETFDQGTPVSFAGTATDAEEGDLSAGLAWSSDRDGPIGSGAAFSNDTLSIGAHTVTAQVTDALGLTGRDSVAVGVAAVTAPALGDPITPSSIADSQARPAVAADAAGRFVAAWQSRDSAGDDADGFSVQARRHDADGTPLGGELQVNTTTAGDQTAPAIGVNGSGAFIVAWQSDDGSGQGVFARRYDASGTALSGEIPINVTTAGDQASPAVGIDAGGGFVVAWESGVGGDLEVFARRFDAGGAPLGGEIPVNVTTAGDQSSPAISVDPAGGFLVTWQSDSSAGGDGDGTSIQARAFAADGTALTGEVQVNATAAGDQRKPALCRFTDGSWVIAWESEHLSAPRFGRGSIPIFGNRARLFATPATPAGAEIEISPGSESQQGEPSVACRRDGEFLAAWQHEMATRSAARGSIPIFNARAAVFATTSGVTVRVSPPFDLDIDPGELPAVAPAGEDGFVAFWQTGPAQDVGTDVVGRCLDNPVPPPPIVVFVDGFESGDAARWTRAMP